MAAYIPTSDINLLDAWNLIDATSFRDTESTAQQSSTTATSSDSFTPGAIEVWGIAIKASVVNNAGSTFSCSIAHAGVDVSGTSVTIDLSASYLDTYPGWIVFKFAAPVTLLAATAYTIKFSSSINASLSIWRAASTNHINKALITTTTAVPTTGDQLIVAGHFTGTGGAGADVIVTMNQTGTPVQFGATTQTPAISICDRGTLKAANAASTDYTMKHRGQCRVYGGTLEIGTSGSRLDSTSTFVWTADSVTTADSGWDFYSGIVDIYGANDRTKWTTLEADVTAGTPKQITVASTTGFLAGDTVYVTTTNPTTRTQDDVTTIVSIDSATTMTLTALAYDRVGTNDADGDRRARVVNLTRNVRLQGNSVSLGAYYDHRNVAVVNMSYLASWYFGSTTAAAGRRGFDIRTYATGSTNLQYCVQYTTGTTNGIHINVALLAAAAPVTIQHSTFIRGGTTSLALSNMPGASAVTVENCLVAGNVQGYAASVGGALLIVRDNELIGTQAAGNTGGLNIAGDNTNTTSTGDIGSNYIAYHNYGILWNTNTSSLAYNADDLTVVQCPSGVYLGVNAFFGPKARQPVRRLKTYSGGQTLSPITLLGAGIWDLIDCEFIKGVGTWTTLIYLSTGSAQDCRFIGCSITHGTMTSLFHTVWTYFVTGKIKFIDCTGLPGTLVATAITAYMFEDMVVSSQKHNGTNDDHRANIRCGAVTTDTTIKDTGMTRSARLTPSSASVKTGSAMIWRARVTGGSTITANVKWRKSVVGDGAAYNGNQPRLVMKRNDAVGIAADVVLATGTNAANGAWESIGGASATFSDEGEVILCVDCDGTAGWLNIQEIAVGSESNDMTYWNDGLPVQYLSGGGSGGGSVRHPFLSSVMG